MTNLKIGDRCIITFSYTGLDDGAIVTVSGYMAGSRWDGYMWGDECDVIVTPMGGKLHSINEFLNLVREEGERPWPSKYLRKLPEVDADAFDDDMYANIYDEECLITI